MEELKFKINDKVWIPLYEAFGIITEVFPNTKSIYRPLAQHNSYNVKFFNKYEDRELIWRFPEEQLKMGQNSFCPSCTHGKMVPAHEDYPFQDKDFKVEIKNLAVYKCYYCGEIALNPESLDKIDIIADAIKKFNEEN